MAVRVTPTVTVTPFTCGRMSFREDQPGSGVVPLTAYLIEHPAGLVVFDSGLGPRFGHEMIDDHLRAIGIDPADITYILNSHLHSGHAGGNALLPNASVIVQRAEWEYATTTTEIDYHVPEFDTGQPIIAIVGEHDVFGDGSVVLIPTPGHTLGHQSARVHTTGGLVILGGDAAIA